jgi:hypothetical protein
MSLLLPFTSFSSFDSCNKISLCVSAYCPNFVNALIILIFTSMAVLLFKMLDSIATPCSVKAIGLYLVPPHLEVPNWLLKFSSSFPVSPNIKSFGNRSRLVSPAFSNVLSLLHTFPQGPYLPSLSHYGVHRFCSGFSARQLMPVVLFLPLFPGFINQRLLSSRSNKI